MTRLKEIWVKWTPCGWLYSRHIWDQEIKILERPSVLYILNCRKCGEGKRNVVKNEFTYMAELMNGIPK